MQQHVEQEEEEPGVPAIDFEQFYHQYFGLVRYNFRFLQGEDQNVKEDLIQEVFIKAWRALKTLKHDGNIAAWIGVIARRVIIDWAREQSRRKQHCQDWDEDYAASLAAPEYAFDLVTSGELDAIDRAYHQLSAVDQEVLRRLITEGSIPRSREAAFKGQRTAPTHDAVRWARHRFKILYKQESA